MDYNALFIDVPLEHIYDLFDKLAYKTVSMYFGFCLLFPGNLSQCALSLNHSIQYEVYRLLYSPVVECWLRVREVPGLIPSQGPRHTKDFIKMQFPCLALNIEKGNTFQEEHYWIKWNAIIWGQIDYIQ